MTVTKNTVSSIHGEGIDIEALKASLGIGDLNKFLQAQKEKEAREALELAEKQRNELETKRMEDLVAKATGEQKVRLEEALTLVKALSDKANVTDADFSAKMKSQAETIEALQGEIKSLLSAREGKSAVSDEITKALFKNKGGIEQEIENVVLLAYLMEKKDIFSTKYGEAHLKAVNSSSSIQVSSEIYETIFSQRILQDVQKLLVIGNMFDELPMGAKNLSMLVEPEAGEAAWVDAATYGTPATTGNEIKTQLAEMTFKTFKLAAKSFMTDETEEDAIITLLPILRRRLVEAHAIAIEKAFMNGDGDAKPTGLLKLAVADGTKTATAATATIGGDTDVAVTGKELMMLRRKLGRLGVNLSKLVLIVSLDAYYDLLTDEEFQDVSQVSAENAIKLSGQVGRIYGMAVVVSEYFPPRAAGAEYAIIVYRDNFVVPRQRTLTVEKERQAERQRDAYYVTQRLNLQRYFNNGIVTAAYKA
jgi:HK97 family phage major capsid protein